MSGTIALLSAAKILKTPLDDIYELGKSKFKNKLKKWKIDSNINELYKRVSSIQKVNTIWQIDKEVNLKKFYYPSKLIINGKAKNINSINRFHFNCHRIVYNHIRLYYSTSNMYITRPYRCFSNLFFINLCFVSNLNFR